MTPKVLMDFEFKKTHKSIKNLPVPQLPPFTILTGVNGAGKTHFLQALKDEAISVRDIPSNRIRHYDWTTLSLGEHGPISPMTIEGERNSHWQQTKQLVENLKGQLSAKISKWGINDLETMDLRGLALLSQSDIEAFVNDPSHARSVYQDLQDTLKRFHSNLTSGISRPHQVLIPIWSAIERATGLPVFCASEYDFHHHYPLAPHAIDPIPGHFIRLFTAYVCAKERNEFNLFKAERRGIKAPFLSDDEFRQKHGPPPWEVLNAAFREADLGIRVKEPDPALPYAGLLYHEDSNEEVRPSELSSGERILVTVALYLFFNQDTRQPTNLPDLLLLDEVDAPLHPSMAMALLRVLQNVLVEMYGHKIILATHSPSTVALSPEDSIYVMDKSTRRIQRTTKDSAIRALTAGVPLLSINIENRRQVYVESEHDVAYFDGLYRLLQNRLQSEQSLVFLPAGVQKEGGCDRVRTLVRQLSRNGVRTVYGIVDWDREKNPSDRVFVLGHNSRYSIEHYILDPLLVAAFLLREKHISRGEIGLTKEETFSDLKGFNDDRLQKIVDNLLTRLNWKYDDPESVVCEYCNGRRVSVPKAHFARQGHELEMALKEAFPPLKRFQHEGQLKREVIHKVLDDMPALIPRDIEMLFRRIHEMQA